MTAGACRTYLRDIDIGQGGISEMPQAGMSAGSLYPDLLLAGVRPERSSRLWVRENRFPAGEVGEPAAVQLGFDDHGLGKLDPIGQTPYRFANAHRS